MQQDQTDQEMVSGGLNLVKAEGGGERGREKKMIFEPVLQRAECSKFIEKGAAHGGENQGLMLIPNPVVQVDWP
jgi:hypothetical protein